MEIERKFWLSSFPEDLPLLQTAVMHQGYISTNPVVRIRSTETQASTTYVLCFKGKGTLVREEIETEIDKALFDRLSAFIGIPLIRKDFRTYALPSGDVLECNLVDAGEDSSFFYAEVEFSSVEKANAFVPPAFLGEEITESKAFSMSKYWKQKKDVYLKMHSDTD